MRATLFCFTAQGYERAKQYSDIIRSLTTEAYTAIVPAGQFAGSQAAQHSLDEEVRQAFQKDDVLFFIGASGIAVRSIAPYLKDKYHDPAVIVADEAGCFIIPLLSGHIGGANRLSKKIAQECGAKAVLTTASDVNGLFAADEWADVNGFVFPSRDELKMFAARIVSGETFGFAASVPIEGMLPDELTAAGTLEGIYLGYDIRESPFERTLYFMPRDLVLGIGTKRNVPVDVIEEAISSLLGRLGVSLESVAFIASSERKADEEGILLFSKKTGIPFVTFANEQLLQKTPASPSAFVEEIIGVGSVCEQAALACAETNELFCEKTVSVHGVALALARIPKRYAFDITSASLKQGREHT